jgi:hypothetical protein
MDEDRVYMIVGLCLVALNMLCLAGIGGGLFSMLVLGVELPVGFLGLVLLALLSVLIPSMVYLVLQRHVVEAMWCTTASAPTVHDGPCPSA